MESFIPEIGEVVKFYGNNLLLATLIKKQDNLGLFLFADGSKICYGIGLPLKYKLSVCNSNQNEVDQQNLKQLRLDLG